MRTSSSIGVVGAVLGAALGVGAIGCGSSGVATTTCDGGACSSHQGSSSSSSSGHGSSSGSSKRSSSSSKGYSPCESPMPVEVNGVDTGFVQCAGNVTHRASVVTCTSSLPRAGGGVCPLQFANPFVDGKTPTYSGGTCSVPGYTPTTAAAWCAANDASYPNFDPSTCTCTQSCSVTDGGAQPTCPTATPTCVVTDGGSAYCSGKGAAATGACFADSECTAHPYGTCGVPGGGGAEPISCVCSYGCLKDSDCAAGQICECGDPVGSCVTATCTSDSACPAGSLCASNAIAPGGCGGPQEFSCQLPADQCFTSNDCPSNFAATCTEEISSAGVTARVCGMSECPAGRPFLVGDVARVAPVTRDAAGWSASTLAAEEVPVSEAVRAALAAHWARVAQMEHASVAAFARFALELLALGAPADLVMSASQAMADETEHARLGFALASRYAGERLGPAALDVSDALGGVSAERVFATLVREGCIGETLAAVEATEALAHAVDPAVKSTLTRVAADETMHAELAFRAARWLFDRGTSAFRAWAEAELARAVAERRAAPRRAEGLSCPEHGLLDGASLDALARQALTTLVEPCWRAVVDRPVAAAPAFAARRAAAP